jgi:anti-sigma regulatory factor (Ser/Thr protein kinase)
MPQSMLSVNRAFAASPGTLATVRSWVREVLGGWVVAASTVDDAVLLTSELATNAVQHARSAFDVTMTRQANAIRIAVADDSHRLPSLPDQVPYAEGGRGLLIVQALSSEWGAEPVPGDGKVVWFAMPS